MNDFFTRRRWWNEWANGVIKFNADTNDSWMHILGMNI